MEASASPGLHAKGFRPCSGPSVTEFAPSRGFLALKTSKRGIMRVLTALEGSETCLEVLWRPLLFRVLRLLYSPSLLDDLLVTCMS